MPSTIPKDHEGHVGEPLLLKDFIPSDRSSKEINGFLSKTLA